MTYLHGPNERLRADLQLGPDSRRIVDLLDGSAVEPTSGAQELGFIEGLGNAMVRGVGGIVESTGGVVRMLPEMMWRPSGRISPELRARLVAEHGEDRVAGVEAGQLAYREAQTARAEELAAPVLAAGREIRTDPAVAPSPSVAGGGAFQPANPRWWSERGGEVVPQLAGQIGLLALTRGQSGAAQLAAFSAPTAVTTAGGEFNRNYDELREAGFSDAEARQRAATGATAAAAAAVALEKLPLGALGVGRGAGAPGLLRRIGAAALAEGAQEVGQDAASDAAAAAVGVRGAFEGAGERYAASGALGALMGGGMGALPDLRGRPRTSPPDVNPLSVARVPTDPAVSSAVTGPSSPLLTPEEMAVAAAPFVRRTMDDAPAEGPPPERVPKPESPLAFADDPDLARLFVMGARVDPVSMLAPETRARVEQAAAAPAPTGPAPFTEQEKLFHRVYDAVASRGYTGADVGTRVWEILTNPPAGGRAAALDAAFPRAVQSPVIRSPEAAPVQAEARPEQRLDPLPAAPSAVARAEPAPALENTSPAPVVPPVPVASESDGPVNLFGEVEQPVVEQAGLFLDRDFAAGEKAVADRVSGRRMTTDEVLAATRAQGRGAAPLGEGTLFEGASTTPAEAAPAPGALDDTALYRLHGEGGADAVRAGLEGLDVRDLQRTARRFDKAAGASKKVDRLVNAIVEGVERRATKGDVFRDPEAESEARAASDRGSAPAVDEDVPDFGGGGGDFLADVRDVGSRTPARDDHVDEAPPARLRTSTYDQARSGSTKLDDEELRRRYVQNLRNAVLHGATAEANPSRSRRIDRDDKDVPIYAPATAGAQKSRWQETNSEARMAAYANELRARGIEIPDVDAAFEGAAPDDVPDHLRDVLGRVRAAETADLSDLLADAERRAGAGGDPDAVAERFFVAGEMRHRGLDTDVDSRAAADKLAQGGFVDLGALARAAGAWVRRNLTSRGDLPVEAYDANPGRAGAILAENRQAAYLLRDLRGAVRRAYGRRPTPEQWEAINGALQSEVDPDTLHPAVRDVVARMRAHLDALSEEIIDSGALEGSATQPGRAGNAARARGERLAEIIRANMGQYLKRSYRVYDDPRWPEQVPDEVREAALDLIRRELGEQRAEAARNLADAEAGRTAARAAAAAARTAYENAARLADAETWRAAEERKLERDARAMRRRADVRAGRLDRVSRAAGRVRMRVLDSFRATETELESAGNLLDERTGRPNLYRRSPSRDADRSAIGNTFGALRRRIGRRLVQAEAGVEGVGARTDAERDFALEDVEREIARREAAIQSGYESRRRQVVGGRYRIDPTAGAAPDADAVRALRDEAVRLRRAAREAGTALGVARRRLARLEARPELSEEEVLGAYNNLLLRHEDGPAGALKGGKLGSKDVSILRRRREIPQEIRALWGEYRDPMVNYARSVASMAQLLSNHRFLREVREAGEGVYLFERPTVIDGVSYHEPISSEGYKPLQPLAGLYTSPEIKAAFEDAVGQSKLPAWLNAYMVAVSIAKFSKTVGSVVTHIRNTVSNTGFAMANGHFRLAHSPEALRAVLADLGVRDSTHGRAFYLRLARLGVVGDGVQEGELRAVLRDANLTPTDRLAGNPKGKALAVVEVLTSLYGAEDGVWKAYAFLNEFQRYRAAYPARPVAEVEQLAARIVRDTYPTYSLVPRAVRGLRRVPFVAPFVSFTSEVLRTTKNVTGLIREEMRDPATRRIGAERLVGLTLAAAFTPALALASRAVQGVDDEEDKAARRLGPPWSREGTLFYLPRAANGSPRFVDLSYTDPYAYLRKPVGALWRGAGDGEAWGAAAGEILKPFASEDVLTGKVLDLTRNRTNSGDTTKPVWNTEDETDEQAKRAAAHLWDGVEPGTLASAERIYYGATGKPSPSGREYDLKEELLATLTGQRIVRVDPEMVVRIRAREYAKRREEARRILSAVAYRKGATDAEIQDAYRRMNNALREIHEDAYEDQRAARLLGQPEKGVKDAFSDAGYSRKELNRLEENRFVPWKPSDEYLGTSSLPTAEARRRRNLLRETGESARGAEVARQSSPTTTPANDD